VQRNAPGVATRAPGDVAAAIRHVLATAARAASGTHGLASRRGHDVGDDRLAVIRQVAPHRRPGARPCRISCIPIWAHDDSPAAVPVGEPCPTAEFAAQHWRESPPRMVPRTTDFTERPGRAPAGTLARAAVGRMPELGLTLVSPKATLFVTILSFLNLASR
jgi:hypothetical protein